MFKVYILLLLYMYELWPIRIALYVWAFTNLDRSLCLLEGSINLLIENISICTRFLQNLFHSTPRRTRKLFTWPSYYLLTRKLFTRPSYYLLTRKLFTWPLYYPLTCKLFTWPSYHLLTRKLCIYLTILLLTRVACNDLPYFARLS
jgi:hypothetical protein